MFCRENLQQDHQLFSCAPFYTRHLTCSEVFSIYVARLLCSDFGVDSDSNLLFITPSTTAQTMLARGQRPTQHTTGAFLDALKRSKQADRCVSVYAEMMDSGVHLGDVCFNIVVSALVQVLVTSQSTSQSNRCQ